MNVTLEPRFSSFAEILRYQASGIRGSDTDPAFTFIEDDKVVQCMSFRALYQQARSIACHLQSETQPGDRALLLYPPGLEFISAFFGCLYAGVIAVPAVLPTSAKTLPRLHLIARDATPSAVLTTAKVRDRFWEQSAQLSPELAAASWLAAKQPGFSNGTGAQTWD